MCSAKIRASFFAPFRANVCNSVHGALLQMLNRLVDMFHRVVKSYKMYADMFDFVSICINFA